MRARIAAGIGSLLVAAGLLRWRRRRSRPPAGPLEDDLRAVGRELADLRASLAADPDPVRALVEAFAAQAELLAEQLDRIAEEAFIETGESRESLRLLRAYDADLHRLAAEIRCLRAKAG